MLTARITAITASAALTAMFAALGWVGCCITCLVFFGILVMVS